MSTERVNLLGLTRPELEAFAVEAGGKATVGQANADGIGSGRFRFNIHTAACGGGEIRGQVLP